MLKLFSRQQLNQFVSVREGEQRLGQAITLPDIALPLSQQLAGSKAAGCQFVLLGVPEDIGPRANLGTAGADQGWNAFLAKFLNLQSNPFIAARQLLLLGEIDCSDLQQQASSLDTAAPEQLRHLRELVSILDHRVYQVVEAIFTAGLMPLIIGGGHNNSYPLLKALASSSGLPANSANLDPHSDFRPREGRHSGNGFNYAKYDGHLQHYFVLGLHELKNSAETLAQLQHAAADYCSYQRIFVRQEVSFQQALEQCIDYVAQGQGDIGIELDTDSISMMPVSAFTNCGISLQAAEQFVYQLAKLPRSRYLHLAEAAPMQHPAGLAAGMNEAGQILAALVYAFVQGKQHQATAI
ncbi:formimidoylglutamase [Rheinheimera maricola]|uniref:Formimidoylglutamase n=1 Tax=Rheinheimera maricola TaxID=2793282 RepID=A0ABS7X6P2_9GAMM|nr:formimidoylglutamase [Rheinheimera maricola]MBZ9611214.1 formimidoylglutamase [Rheinheimera maricola]